MQEPEGFIFCLLKQCDQDPLGFQVLKIPWKTGERGGDLSVGFFWPAQIVFRGREGPLPSLISAPAGSRSGHRLCSDCGFRHLHLPTWFWLEKEEFLSEYTQLPHEAYMHSLHSYPVFISLCLALLRNRKILILVLLFFQAVNLFVNLQVFNGTFMRLTLFIII